MILAYRASGVSLPAIMVALVITVIFSVAPVLAVSNTIDEKQIQALFDKAVNVSGTVGAQLSIIKEGRQYDFVYGLANAELNIPMTQETVIQIGSTTKVFNAMLVMTLVDQGLLDLDRPVIHYIPAFSLSDPVATKTVTLRQLLSMSSGLDNGDYANAYGSGDDALARYVANLKNLPQHFSPGSAFGYSNAGTDVAGYVAERVTGLSWDKLLMNRILKPAGLNHAVTLASDRVYQKVSVGHRRDADTGEVSVIRPWAITRGQGPAGSTLSTSAHDLARFGRLFLDEGVADTGTRILSKKSIQTMMSPQIRVPVSYANAWGVGPSRTDWEGVVLWGHGGSNRSGRSFLYWLPEQNAVMAFIVNTPAARDRFMKVVFRDVAKAAFGVSKRQLEKPSEVAVVANPERYVGSYGQVNGTVVIEKGVGNRLIKRSMRHNKELYRADLIPLGDDRFFVDRGDSANALLPMDMAFFGRDKKGRATNMIDKVFPLSRNMDADL